MFVDIAKVLVKAGDGGDGAVSFRHEKFVDKGGPDGGDGGNGGDIIFEASRNQDTLATFRFHKRLEAQPGQPGSKRKRHGRSGNDLIIKVPIGTVISDQDGKVLEDFTHDGQKSVIAMGGKGGFGNAHFTSSTRQTPRVAEKGDKGEEIELILELKMIADVGLIGLPNAGKSTLLSVISNARPEIANYPFTTLTPNLGVVDVDDVALLFADIPGLIEGASKGKGLGDEFLRHVERTMVLAHLIDAYQDDIVTAYKTIRSELKAYSVDLSKRKQVVALTKIDGLDEEIVQDRINELKSALPKGTKVFAISSISGQGTAKLLREIKDIVQKERSKLAEEAKIEEDKLPVLKLQTDESWKVEKTEKGFEVKGKKIERFAGRTDYSNPHSVQRLRDIMKKMGIVHELNRQGVQHGDKITVSGETIEY